MLQEGKLREKFTAQAVMDQPKNASCLIGEVDKPGDVDVCSEASEPSSNAAGPVTMRSLCFIPV